METRFGVVYIGLVGMERGMYVNREHEKPLALLSPLINRLSCSQFLHCLSIIIETVDESCYVPVRIAEQYFSK